MFYRYAAESIAVVTFNTRLGLFDQNPDEKSVQIVKASKLALQATQDSVFGKSFAHKWYKNSTYKMFEEAVGITRSFSAAHVSQAQTALEDKVKSGQLKEDEPNLLLSLLSEKDLTQEDIVVIMATLYSAGTDSVRLLLFNPRAARTEFDSPEKYLPERWLRSDDGAKKDTAHNMIVLPFGHGARSCIGRRFALQEVYLLATKILQSFYVDV